MSTEDVLNQLRELVTERDWDQFHTTENLAKSVAIEASELLELFQWTAEAPLEQIVSELADVLTYCYLMAAKLGVDPQQAILDKLEVTKSKYPVDKSRGVSTKYTDL